MPHKQKYSIKQNNTLKKWTTFHAKKKETKQNYSKQNVQLVNKIKKLKTSFNNEHNYVENATFYKVSLGVLKGAS